MTKAHDTTARTPGPTDPRAGGGWRRRRVLTAGAGLVAAAAGGCVTSPAARRVPTGAALDRRTLVRRGVSGDNWSITWADDGHQYTSQDDGSGWRRRPAYSTRVWRIEGGPGDDGPDPFRADDLPGFPAHPFPGGWFGYGITSLDGVLYHFISRCPRERWSGPFEGARLIHSPDRGATWFRHDGADATLADPSTKDRRETFFWHEADDWRFSCLEFVQCGRDGHDAKDGFVYVYSPGGRRPELLRLARVPRDRVLERDAYRYLRGYEDGAPVWTGTADPTSAGVAHAFPAGWGWYSWLPSVVYNRPLDLFIMATGGTERAGDTWMHTRTGSLHLLWSEEPWGPWRPFFRLDDWHADSPANRLYQPKLSPKWIGDDGRRMVLIFSDAQANAEGRSHTVNYRWNQIELRLELATARA